MALFVEKLQLYVGKVYTYMHVTTHSASCIVSSNANFFGAYAEKK